MIGTSASGDGGVYIDGTFGAGGYTRAILGAGARVIGIDRDPEAIAAAPVWSLQSRRPADAGRGPLLRARRVARELGRRGGRRRRARHRRLVDAARPGRSAASPSGSTARSTCAWTATGRAPPTSSTALQSAISPHLRLRSARSGMPARIARAIVAARAEAPVRRPRSRLPSVVAASCGRSPDKIHPATRMFQALRIFVNDELGELAARACRGRARAQARRPARVVTFHSLEDRIVKRFIADRCRHRPASRHRPEAAAQAPTFEHADASGRSRPPTPRSPPIRAPVRPSCAPPIAPRRRRAPLDPSSAAQGSPIAGVMKGADCCVSSGHLTSSRRWFRQPPLCTRSSMRSRSGRPRCEDPKRNPQGRRHDRDVARRMPTLENPRASVFPGGSCRSRRSTRRSSPPWSPAGASALLGRPVETRCRLDENPRGPSKRRHPDANSKPVPM